MGYYTNEFGERSDLAYVKVEKAKSRSEAGEQVTIDDEDRTPSEEYKP